MEFAAGYCLNQVTLDKVIIRNLTNCLANEFNNSLNVKQITTTQPLNTTIAPETLQ